MVLRKIKRDEQVVEISKSELLDVIASASARVINEVVGDDLEHGLALTLLSASIGSNVVDDLFGDYDESDTPYPIGTKLKIINGGRGAYGSNNLTGVVTDKESSNGLTSKDEGYNIDCGEDGVWRIHLNADVEVRE